MSKQVTIIGAGPGGYVAAIRAAAMGAEVTIIEKENVGGTCLNYGCIPSKIMKTTADLFLKFNEAEKFGIRFDGNVYPEMVALMERKRKIIQTQQKGILSLLKKSRVKFEHGQGYIKSMGLACVRNDEGVEKDIPFDRLIIATGTKPFNVQAFPFDGESILSSNHLLQLEAIPKSIMIVGGGVIGCEFAFILSAFGSKVTVVEALSRLLPLDSVDESCSKVLQREMKKMKIKFITDRAVEKAEKSGEMLSITVGASPFSDSQAASKVKQQIVEVEKMAVCIGRTPLSHEIGLENLGLELDNRGWIQVNEKMETMIDNIYAIGDILGPSRIMLAHVASHEGMVAAENCMGGSRTMDYNAVPGAIFTMPEIGNVGLSEKQALDMDFDVACTSVNFRSLGKAQAMGEIAGEVKIVADKISGKVLGVHIIGPHATDLISEGTVAVKNGLSVLDLAKTIHAHPTLAEIMSEVSLKGAGMAIHA